MRIRGVSLVAAICIAACARPDPPLGVAPPRATAIAPPISDPAPPALRLPAVVRPLRYDLDLFVDPDADTFRGRIGIDLELAAATRVVWLSATALTVDEAALDMGGTTLRARAVAGGDDFIGLVFERELAPGKARLSVAYRGAIDKTRSRGIYSAREGGGDTYAYTFFEPTDARRAFPCFDEPGYKVPWKLALHVRKDHLAFANARVVAERAEGDKEKVVEFEETKPLPSYLVAFVVGPFDVVAAGTAGRFGTPLRFVVPKGRGAETEYAAKVTPRIVGELEDYFGMPYPYGKLDVAVVAREWGTMEHPGLVALGQPLTLIKPEERTVARQQRYATIATHELTHYWFGDYVTTAWWDDTWLNEALAQWLGNAITARIEPSWHYELQRLHEAFWGMEKDALPTAKRIRQPVETKSDIESSFDGAITYAKGQAVLAMVEGWISPEKMRSAVRAYMAAHAWKTATADDFFAALDAEKPGSGAVLKTFVDQPGVPSIALECRGREIAITATRYQPLGAALAPETWKVPVCVRHAKGRACVLVDGEHATMPVDACPSWLVGNADGLGYYHVAYDAKTLRALVDPKSGLTVAERIAVVHDAAALLASGDLAMADALALVAETASAHERYLVVAGLDLLRMVRDAAMSDDDVRRRARFLRESYAAPAAALGLRHRAGESAEAELLRPDVIGVAALRGADPDLRKRALEAARKWIADPSAIEPDMVDVVLAAAAKSNDEKLFAALVARAKSEPDHRKVGVLLRALGAFTSPVLARAAEEIMVSSAFDLRDSVTILEGQLRERATRELAWTFMKASFDALAARMRGDEVTWRLIGPVGVFCDEAHRVEIKAFLEKHVANVEGGARAAANLVDEIGLCAATFAKNQESLHAFLAKH